MTSTKLKEFIRCQKCYRWQYEDEIPNPIDQFEDEDHFVIGLGVDDLVTHGEEFYKEKYAVVTRRLGKSEGKIELTKGTDAQIKACYSEFLQNPLFMQQHQKKALEFDFDGIKLRGELDGFDKEKQVIVDVKTCANLATFNPEFYVLQMSFYQWLVEEIEGVKCDALLEVVDKYKYFSRSRAYLYSRSTLEAYRGTILQALSDYKEAKESGLWLSATSENILLSCPYYGREGHGRPVQPIYF